MQSFFPKFFSRLYVPVSWTIFIFILLSLPGSVLPSEKGFEIPGFDKFVHTILFGGFVICWCLYYEGKKNTRKKKWLTFTWILCVAIAYGTGMEYLQKYVIPNRDFETGDIVADTAGALLGFGFCIIRMTFKMHQPIQKSKPL